MIKKLALLLAICLSFVQVEQVQAAHRKCLKGNDLGEQEIQIIKDYNKNHQREIERLSVLSLNRPDNKEIKKELEHLNNLLFDPALEISKNIEQITLPSDLKQCQEYNIPYEELAPLLQKWILAASYRPKNFNYLYNFKLLNTIMFSKIF